MYGYSVLSADQGVSLLYSLAYLAVTENLLL